MIICILSLNNCLRVNRIRFEICTEHQRNPKDHYLICFSDEQRIFSSKKKMTLHWFSLNYNHIFILCRINIVLSKSISSTDVWCADDPLFFLLLLLEKQICFLSWHSCGSGLVISKHKAEVRRWRLGFRLADNQGWKNIKVWLEMTSSRLADHHGYSNKYLGRVGERLSS